MNADDSQNKGEKPDPNKCNSFPKEIALKYDVTPINDLTQAITVQINHRQQESGNPQSGANRQAAAQERANVLYRRSFVANVGLLIVTFFLFCWNIKGINAASKSADAADKTFQELHRQFVIQNEPYLEISGASLYFTKEGGITMFYSIANLGDHVVRGIAKTDTLIYISQSEYADFIKAPFKRMDTTTFKLLSVEYYSKGKSPYEFGQMQSNIDNIIYGFKNKIGFVFYLRESEYENPITGKIRIFRCVMEWYPMKQEPNLASNIKFASNGYVYRENDNYDTDDSIGQKTK